MFTLLCDWLNVWHQTVIAFLMIFSVGIVHGANDLQLIQKKTQKHTQQFFFTTLLIYIGVVLVGIALFYLLPSFGLLFFVGFSAFHFGEQHLESKLEIDLSSFLKAFVYIGYGIAVFGLLFTLQWEEVHQVIYFISGQFISKQFTEVFFFMGLGLFIVSGLFSPNLRGWLFFEIVLLAFLGFLFSRTSLILGFGLYFVVWHSIPSMQDQLFFLYPNGTKREWKYLKSSAPYWVISLVALAGVYFFFDLRSVAFLPLFFSFLAAITFPHTVVMGWLKLSEEKPSSPSSNASNIPSK